MKTVRVIALFCIGLLFVSVVVAQPGPPDQGEDTGDTAQDETPSNRTGGQNTAEDAQEGGGPPSFVGDLVDAITPDFLDDLFASIFG